MTHAIHLRDEFGPRLCDGSDAYRYRVSKIDPYPRESRKILEAFERTMANQNGAITCYNK